MGADGQDLYRTATGIYLPATGSLRAWVKLRGEPAQIFVETPHQFKARWDDFRSHLAQNWVSFHNYEYGQAVYFTREALRELAYIQITYKTAPPRDTAGSWWLHQCPCEVCRADGHTPSEVSVEEALERG